MLTLESSLPLYFAMTSSPEASLRVIRSPSLYFSNIISYYRLLCELVNVFPQLLVLHVGGDRVPEEYLVTVRTILADAVQVAGLPLIPCKVLFCHPAYPL